MNTNDLVSGSSSVKSNTYDLIVIGAGSGGVRLARMSASKGVRVAIIESRYLGGSCVNVGCVPKKLFVYGSHAGESIEDAKGYGFKIAEGAVSFDWTALVENKNKEIKRLNDVYRNLLETSGVDLIEGTAKIQGPHTVQVGDRVLNTESIAIATGSWPSTPNIPGKEHIVTSNEMFFLDALPKRAVVWGGGYIGLEFAGILAGLGVKTTVVNRGELVLRGFDRDVREFVSQEIVKKGVTLLANTSIQGVEKQEGEYHVMLSDGTKLETDLVMAATGRNALTQGLGLEDIGVRLQPSGHIEVDEGFRTSVPSIYALGDVIGTPQLTPVALSQAMVLSRRLFEGSNDVVDYHLIPSAVFCQPNIGTIGFTEEEAREDGMIVDIYQSNFRAMKHALTGRDERCYMKLVVHQASGRVIGAHMVGDDAGEIIQGLAVAIKAGATKSDFDSTLGIHPTSAEEFVTMRTKVPG